MTNGDEWVVESVGVVLVFGVVVILLGDLRSFLQCHLYQKSPNTVMNHVNFLSSQTDRQRDRHFKAKTSACRYFVGVELKLIPLLFIIGWFNALAEFNLTS